MSLSVSFKENIHTIKIAGKFDFSIQKEFRDAYRYNDSDASYIIDLSETSYVDSAALGMLLLLRQKLNGKFEKLKVIRCNTSIMEVFQVSNIDKLINIS